MYVIISEKNYRKCEHEIQFCADASKSADTLAWNDVSIVGADLLHCFIKMKLNRGEEYDVKLCDKCKENVIYYYNKETEVETISKRPLK